MIEKAFEALEKNPDMAGHEEQMQKNNLVDADENEEPTKQANDEDKEFGSEEIK